MSEHMIMVNGARLWVVEQGAGFPMMLCNGGPGCCDYLGPVAQMVADIAHVYRFEPRGCGRSSQGGPYDLQTTLADLEAIRASLGHQQWVIGGHSAGADLALAYALSYSAHVIGLVHMSGTGVQDDRQWHAAYEAGRATRSEVLPVFEYPYNSEVNRAGNASWRAFIKQPMLLRRIAECTVPSLVLYGSDDIRPAWSVEQFANLLPKGRFEMIAGAGHHLELTKPEALKDLLRAFLAELFQGQGSA